MNHIERVLFHKLPWTGAPMNALGTPWTVGDVGLTPSGKTDRIIIRNCFGAAIANTSATNASRVTSNFAVAVMNACDDARRVVSKGNKTSWDYTVVGEIDRVHRTTTKMVSILTGLNNESLAGAQGKAIVKEWWKTVQPANRRAFYVLTNMANDADGAVAEAANALKYTLKQARDTHFVFKIMGQFSSHIATDRLQGRPLIVPRHAVDADIASKFRNAKSELQQVRAEASPEFSATYAAWAGVILPSMNSFWQVQEQKLGIPVNFPQMVACTQAVWGDIVRLVPLLRDVAPEQSLALADVSSSIDMTREKFAQKIDGNFEMLALDDEQRRQIYREFHSPACKYDKPAKPHKPKRGEGQFALDFTGASTQPR